MKVCPLVEVIPVNIQCIYGLENESKKKPKRSSDDESDGEPVDATPRRKKQKQGDQSDALPAWTRSEDAIVYVQLTLCCVPSVY